MTAHAIHLMRVDIVHRPVVESMVRTIIEPRETLAVTVPVHRIDRPFPTVIEQRGAFTEGGIVGLVVFQVDLTLHRRAVGIVVAQHHIDYRTAHLHPRRRVVHHLDTLHPRGRQALQHRGELLGGHRGDLAVEDDGHGQRTQLQRAVHLDHARQLLQRVVDIVDGLVFDQSWQVVDQFVAYGLDHRALALDHHFGQGMDDAVHA